MKTKQEIREGKTRMINQGRLMSELKVHKGYLLLESRLKTICEDAKSQIIVSESFEEFRFRRGYYEGLNALLQEVDTIISKGKSQEQQIKK